jgi:hypothetical protein
MMLARHTLVLGLVVIASTAIPVRAQERPTEDSQLRHVYDDSPVWESTAAPIVGVVLEMPSGLSICRQGRISILASGRIAHMGCWPDAYEGRSVLDVPTGPAFLALHRGVEDLSWIGDGAIPLRSGSRLRLTIEDRLPIRVVGWVVGIGALVAAIVCFIVSGSNGPVDRITGTRGSDPVTLVAGSALAALAFAVGIPLVAWGDSVSIVDVSERSAY